MDLIKELAINLHAGEWIMTESVNYPFKSQENCGLKATQLFNWWRGTHNNVSVLQ